MGAQVQTEEISFGGLKRDLASYSWDSLRQDLSAGLSVALITLPQALAYAMLAGLPLMAGLMASIYSSMITALCGSSRHLVTGPSNAMAILVQTGTAEVLYTYFRGVTGAERDLLALQILTQLSLLVGVFQILAAGFKLGRLTQFVSHSVVTGYIAGAAFAVVVNQLYVFLGIMREPGVHSMYERAVYLVTHLLGTHWPTALFGACSLIILLTLKRMDKRIPAAVIMLAFAVLGTHLQELPFLGQSLEEIEPALKLAVVADNGSNLDVIPHLAWPAFNPGIMNGLLPVAFALALVSVMESSSVAKAISASSGERLSINQEIFGVGMGNLVSSLITGMPITGSPSRSAVNYASGAQTRFAAVFNASFVILFVLLFSFFIERIPLAALSALLLASAVNIVNWRHFFMCVKATRSDSFVLWVTLLACLFFSLDVAFYIGIALSVILYLKKAAIPQLVEFDFDEHGELVNPCSPDKHAHRAIRIIKVEGELFFGAADLFQTTLKTIAEDDTTVRVIILQLKNARDIDATVCLALNQLGDYLRGSGRHLLACGITMQIWEVLSDSGVIEHIGKENLFLFDERHPHLSIQKALNRAKMLAQRAAVPARETPPELAPAAI